MEQTSSAAALPRHGTLWSFFVASIVANPVSSVFLVAGLGKVEKLAAGALVERLGF